MCGLAGVYAPLKADLALKKDSVLNAMREMSYRGPDAQGEYSPDSGGVILGHLRLSIHDLSPAGSQPMHMRTANGLYSIVFNGEIYNFIEIRSDLEALGYHFNTGTDTEVILAAYAAWGSDCLPRLNGMFSLAIYHEESHSLFIARDRLGKKPLYYYQSLLGDIIFSSEIKSLLPLIYELNPDYDVERDVAPDIVDSYFSLGYVPGDSTFYPRVKRLLPGTYMKCTPSASSISNYWSLDLSKKVSKGKGENELVEESRALFENSLSLRLRSDVDVGVFLSGGLDSSVVVAGLASQGVSLNTYSVRFDSEQFGAHYDETHFANAVSSKFGTKHQTITMTPKMFEDFIPQFVRLMDEPVTEAAAISLFMVSKLASNDVKVVLSGEGSDEIFGGYHLYQRMVILEKIRSCTTPVGAMAIGWFSKLLPDGNKLKKYMGLVSQPFEKRYRGISVYPEEYRKSLYNADFKSLLNRPNVSSVERFYESIFEKSRGHSLLSRMSHFDLHTWLVDDLLIKADRMSMANSQELRCPFLDYRLVELAASYPDNVKIKNGDPKWLVKQWYKDVLPPEVTSREKVGFPTPLKMMFSGPLKNYVSSRLMCSDAKVFKFVERSTVHALCSEHFGHKQDHHTILWQLLVLEEHLQHKSEIAEKAKHRMRGV